MAHRKTRRQTPQISQESVMDGRLFEGGIEVNRKLTAKRVALIEKFKNRSLEIQGDPLGSEEWVKQLGLFLRSKNQNVSCSDIRRWIDANPRIMIMEVVYDDHAQAGGDRDWNASTGQEQQRSSSSMSEPRPQPEYVENSNANVMHYQQQPPLRQSSEFPQSISAEDKMARENKIVDYYKIFEAIGVLANKFQEHHELRTSLVHLQQISTAVSRNHKRLLFPQTHQQALQAYTRQQLSHIKREQQQSTSTYNNTVNESFGDGRVEEVRYIIP